MRNIKNFLFISIFHTYYYTGRWRCLPPRCTEELVSPRKCSLRWSSQTSPSRHKSVELKYARNLSAEKNKGNNSDGKIYACCVKQKKKVRKYIYTKSKKIRLHNMYFDCIRWPLRMVNANNTEWTRRYSPKHIWARVTKTIATFGNIFHSILLNAW